jgi:polysaccharide chain length determinant protein (PEP-CTERM system associated)
VQELFADVKIYLRMVWRYRWMALAFATIVCLIGWGVVAILPNVYQVRATVRVERSSMLPALLKAAEGDLAEKGNPAQEMASLMAETMLVKPNLALVAHEIGLGQEADTPEKLDKLLEWLARKIHISADPVKHQELANMPSAYTVTYEHSDPVIAQRLVKALLDRFQETIQTVVRKDVDDSKRFVDERIEEYHRKMDVAEQKIQEFKEKHPAVLEAGGALLEAGGTYYARLEDAKNQYKAALLELQEAEKEVSIIRAEGGAAGAGAPITREGRPVGAIDLRIAELEKALAELRVKFTEQHPDVIIAKRALEEWRTMKSRKGQEGAGAGTSDRGGASYVDPGYQAWQVQLRRAEAKVASVRSRVEEYQRRVAQLQESIGTIPRTQVELAKLNREYSFLKDNYQTLLVRREDALVADRLEHAKDLKLSILEAPRDPLRPVSPDRLLLNTLVLVLGIGAGVGLVFLVSQIDPVIYSRHDLLKVAALPVLGTVSWSETAGGNRSPLEVNRYFYLAFTALVFLYLGLDAMYVFQVEALTRLAGFDFGSLLPSPESG